MLQIHTPYNTYLNTGLTPTPICTVSTIALKAVLHAPPGPWLYFTVIDKRGDEAFSSTFAQQLEERGPGALEGHRVNWRLGVAGSPVSHSLSPRLHEAGLRLAGLEGSSRWVELGLADADELSEMLVREFDALSVTSPLKDAAFELCDEASDVATRTNSVNTLLLRDGRVLGASTDGEGFVSSLTDAFGDVIANAHAVVLGAGGAASAIVDAVVEHAVASVVVLARNAARAGELQQRYQNVFADPLVYRPVDLIVNTMPVAARRRGGRAAGCALDTIAVDITYEPRDSAWRHRYARRRLSHAERPAQCWPIRLPYRCDGGGA